MGKNDEKKLLANWELYITSDRIYLVDGEQSFAHFDKGEHDILKILHLTIGKGE
jgi:hypothetical protein